MAATSARSQFSSGQGFQEALIAWFECFECTNEFERVVRLGRAAVPTLIAVLRQGPSPATIEVVQQRLRLRYAHFPANSHKQPRQDRDTYVKESLAAYVARYRGRAATALGAIGGPDAKRALQAALQSRDSPVLRRAVEDAIARLK